MSAAGEPNGARDEQTDAHAGLMHGQTIEEIEAGAALIVDQENAATIRLARFLRDLAVELPPESRLPRRLAEAAKTIDVFTADRSIAPMPWMSHRP